MSNIDMLVNDAVAAYQVKSNLLVIFEIIIELPPDAG